MIVQPYPYPGMKEWVDTVRIVFPKFTNGGTHLSISGMAMAKNAPNKDNALALMEFRESEEGQMICAEINREYPVPNTVPASELVENRSEFERDSIGLSEIAAHRAKAVKLVEEVGFDG